MELMNPPYNGNFSLVWSIFDIIVKNNTIDIMLFAMGKMGNKVSGIPILRDAIICQKVIPIMATISTSKLVIIANIVPLEFSIFYCAFITLGISPKDIFFVASRLIFPTRFRLTAYIEL